jgi:ADP-ribose pyrophosphatase
MASVWRRLNRKTLYNTAHLTLHEDEIELPSGDVIDDYSVVDLPDGVLVVATDTSGRLLLFEEYKYAVDSYVLTFPAGGIDKGESPTDAALRELLEETGYAADKATLLSSTYPYPSKLEHITHIVRVENAVLTSTHTQDITETIKPLELVEPSEIPRLIREGRITATYMLASFALAFPEYLAKN